MNCTRALGIAGVLLSAAALGITGYAWLSDATTAQREAITAIVGAVAAVATLLTAVSALGAARESREAAAEGREAAKNAERAIAAHEPPVLAIDSYVDRNGDEIRVMSSLTARNVAGLKDVRVMTREDPSGPWAIVQDAPRTVELEQGSEAFRMITTSMAALRESGSYEWTVWVEGTDERYSAARFFLYTGFNVALDEKGEVRLDASLSLEAMRELHLTPPSTRISL